MMTFRFRQALMLVIAVSFGVFAVALQAEPSNKWRIEFDHKTDNDGAIVLRIAPVGGDPVDVETRVPAKTSENHVAKILRDSLDASLGDGYHVEVDDGEDVLIKKRGKTPDFDLTLVSSSLTGLGIKLQRE